MPSFFNFQRHAILHEALITQQIDNKIQKKKKKKKKIMQEKVIKYVVTNLKLTKMTFYKNHLNLYFVTKKKSKYIHPSMQIKFN